MQKLYNPTSFFIVGQIISTGQMRMLENYFIFIEPNEVQSLNAEVSLALVIGKTHGELGTPV